MLVRTVILRNHLRAALVCAAVHDIRYYLNSVLIEVYPDRKFVVCTDGHRLAVLRDDTNQAGADVPFEGVSFIMPRELAERVKADKRIDAVTVSFDTESKCITIEDAGATYTGQAIDCKFPNWRRVLPSDPSPEDGKPGQFNMNYLAGFAKVAKELGGGRWAHPHIWHNGESGALVTIDEFPEFMGVVMPMRSSGVLRDVRAFKSAPTVPEAELQVAA